MAERLSPEGYAATGGHVCPACAGRDLASGRIAIPGGVQYLTRQAACENCGATWTAVYELTGYEGLVAPKTTQEEETMPAIIPGALHASPPDASPHEARGAYEAFMRIYAPELPAVWDALPARMQRAWGVVVETVRLNDQGRRDAEDTDT